jgi:folate-dependent phosphoribosylglycinamide formyltransferase PurN
LIAKVKPRNAASIHCFQKNGFGETYECYEYELNRWDGDHAQDKVGEVDVLFLTNNANTLEFFDWIGSRCKASIISDKIDERIIDNLKPRLIVSYNYDYIISCGVINRVEKNIINLHISLLPFNRGFSPNIWSFIDDTPKGVTIHMLSEKLDEGDIIYQKELKFDPDKETLKSSYDRLNEEITLLFMEHWQEIISGKYRQHTRPQMSSGSSHTIKDLEKLQELMDFEWTDNVSRFLEKYRKEILGK